MQDKTTHWPINS